MNCYKKYFVLASSDDRHPGSETSSSGLCRETRGSDIQKFYDEIISSNSSSLHNTETSKKSHRFANEFANTHGPDQFHITSKFDGNKLLNTFLKAAQDNDVQTLNLCMEQQCKVDVADSFGWSALLCAVKNGAEDAVKFLLDRGADPLSQEKTGKSAYFFAKQSNNKRILKMLRDSVWQCNACRKEQRISPDPAAEESNCATSESEGRTSIISLFEDYKQKLRNLPPRYEIPEHNAGFQMMLRSGWDKNKGLGPRGTGIKYPAKTVLKRDQKGLGNAVSKSRITHFKAHDKRAISRVKKECRRRDGQLVCKVKDVDSKKRKERRDEIRFRIMFH